MTSKQEKQSKSLIHEKQKKSKKTKNPYNINISFNINNPKKVISNQIHKTIKVNHYSINQQDPLNKLKKMNFSKVLNPTSKNHSASFSKSKDLLKNECLKELSKYECYLQNQIPPKKHKKSKSKPYDIQTKSKSDFMYSNSILNIPFPENDPLPDAAVKRLNKMKKYFLQKIGSMDITMPEDTAEPTSDLIHHSKNLRTSQIKIYDEKHQRKESKEQKKSDKDDIMTEKLSEYQYENLISYENENESEEKNKDQALESKEIFYQEQPQTFPRIILDNLNSMTIKNEYLRHHSKFLSQNMDLFKQESSNNNFKKSKKSAQLSFDDFSAQKKSKIINPFQSNQRRHERKQQKQEKSKVKVQNHHSESKAMKQKIKIIQQFLLKSDSSKSILKIGGQKSEKYLGTKLQTSSKVEDFYKKNLKKQYVIKTEIELPNHLVNEIKRFQSKKLTEDELKSDQCKQRANDLIQQGLIEKMSYLQFLSNRDVETDKKQTNQLIQGYIDLLKEHLNLDCDISNRRKQQVFDDIASATQIKYIPSQKSDSYQIYPQQDLSIQDNEQQKTSTAKSQVSSYIYGESQNIQLMSDVEYSPERNQRIELQREMRQELTKRLTIQLQQRQISKVQTHSPEVITNLNLIEKQLSPSQQNESHQQTIEAKQSEKDLNSQMDTLLGFIQQNISFNNADKEVLRDLYEKLTKISAQQYFDSNQEVNCKHQENVEKIKEISPKIEQTYPLKTIKTPKKPQNLTRKLVSHKRSYSTQKDTTKISTHVTSSDDINLWDLILVEERLNKKYNQITHQKDRQLFEIETDPTLSLDEYQDKIDELQKWENQAKKQILQTKKEIKMGIENLRKMFTPDAQMISFKMKSLSEKQFIPRFDSAIFQENPLERSTVYNNQCWGKKEKIQVQSSPEGKQLRTNSAKEQNKKDVKTLSVNLDCIFIQESEQSKEKEEQTKISPCKEKIMSKFDESKISSKQREDKKSQKLSYIIGDKEENFNSVSRIQLFRTGSSRYKDLFQNHEEESVGSSRSSASSEIYNNDILYQQNQDEKQEFIDLLKVEKYKLGNLHEIQDEFDTQIIEDTLQKLPQIESQTTIQPKQVSIGNFKVSQEDKLDICQFILLDLCIELYQETLDLEDSQIKKGSYKACGPHRVMNAIFSFIKKEKKKPKKKGPKIGIHTELQTVKDYVQKIKKYIENLQEKSSNKLDSFSKDKLIINRISSPIGPTASEILKTMRFYEDQIFESREETISPEFSQNEGLNSLILPVHVFTNFEENLQSDKQFSFDTYFEDSEKEKNRLAFLKNVTHVHHKALFDALNEMLDFERPFGIWGQPFPWKKKNARLKQLTEENVHASLKKSCDKVIECAMYMCGLLIDKEESLVKNTTVSEAYIEEVKEDRMSKMIINDFLENQGRFYFLDDEETQIMLQTSYVVWLLLIQEAVKQCSALLNRNF